MAFQELSSLSVCLSLLAMAGRSFSLSLVERGYLTLPQLLEHAVCRTPQSLRILQATGVLTGASLLLLRSFAVSVLHDSYFDPPRHDQGVSPHATPRMITLAAPALDLRWRYWTKAIQND